MSDARVAELEKALGETIEYIDQDSETPTEKMQEWFAILAGKASVPVFGQPSAHDAVVAERDALKAENARLSMEMESYRSKLTPQDAAAMQAVVDALYAEKTRAALRTGDEGMAMELKPCPFCGTGETISEPNSKNWTGMRWDILSWRVRHWCGQSNSTTFGNTLNIRGKTQDEAEAKWNTRAYPASRKGRRVMDEKEYEARIPKCCSRRTLREHMDDLMLCWSLVHAVEERQPMDCTECDLAIPGIPLLSPVPTVCERCIEAAFTKKDCIPFEPKPDHPRWLERKKATHED